jgi:hypothetical protein
MSFARSFACHVTFLVGDDTARMSEIYGTMLDAYPVLNEYLHRDTPQTLRGLEKGSVGFDTAAAKRVENATAAQLVADPAMRFPSLDRATGTCYFPSTLWYDLVLSLPCQSLNHTSTADSSALQCLSWLHGEGSAGKSAKEERMPCGLLWTLSIPGLEPVQTGWWL